MKIRFALALTILAAGMISALDYPGRVILEWGSAVDSVYHAIYADSSHYADSCHWADSSNYTAHAGASTKSDSLWNKGAYRWGQYFFRDNVPDTSTAWDVFEDSVWCHSKWMWQAGRGADTIFHFPAVNKALYIHVGTGIDSPLVVRHIPPDTTKQSAFFEGHIFARWFHYWCDSALYAVHAHTADSATYFIGAAKKADSLWNKGAYVYGQYFFRDNVPDTITDGTDSVFTFAATSNIPYYSFGNQLPSTPLRAGFEVWRGGDYGLGVLATNNAGWFDAVTSTALYGRAGTYYGVLGYAGTKYGAWFKSPSVALVADLGNAPTSDTIAQFMTRSVVKSFIDSTGALKVLGGTGFFSNYCAFISNPQGDTGILDTNGLSVGVNGKERLRVDYKGIRLRDTTFISTSTMDTIKIYFRNDTLYVQSKLGSYFLNLTQATVLFKSGWMLFDQMKPATNDSSSSSLGSLPTPYGKIFACSLWIAGKQPYAMFTTKVNARDTLLIPLWNNTPISGTVGSFALDTTGTDTIWAITQGGKVAIYPPPPAPAGAMTKTAILDSLAVGVGLIGAPAYTNALLGGDSNNIVSGGTHNVIAGGTMDTILATGDFCFMGGGGHNKINQLDYNTIIGGSNNYINQANAGIVAGLADTISGAYGFIGGGSGNAVTGTNGSIIGAINSKITGTYSAIAGGGPSYIRGAQQGILGGGYDSCGVNGSYAAVVAGTGNFNDGPYGVIVGGQNNNIISTAWSAGIIGGINDTISIYRYGVILGGKQNRVKATNSVILGGSNNIIRGGTADSNCVALGSAAVIDSCIATVAINRKISQTDSALAVCKQILVNGTALYHEAIITENGGYGYLVKNSSGGTIYQGQLVVADSTNTGDTIRVILTSAASDQFCIGVVWSASIADGNLGYIITTGMTPVATILQVSKPVKGGNRILVTSATVGLADCFAIESVPNHYLEMGQPLSSKRWLNANGDSLCWADIHKN